MDICAVSLPGLIPGFIVSIIPHMPVSANLSMFGVSAPSSGVLNPKSSKGRSAIPSIIIIIPFILYHNQNDSYKSPTYGGYEIYMFIIQILL